MLKHTNSPVKPQFYLGSNYTQWSFFNTMNIVKCGFALVEMRALERDTSGVI